MGVRCEGVKGATAKPPCRSRRSEIPYVRERAAMVARPATWSRPFGATQHSCWIERLGGRVCGRAKLEAGTLRCLHLCWRLSWNWSDAEQLGRCPKPHKGRCPLTLQGAILRLSYQVQHRTKKGKTLRALCVRMKLPHTN